MQITPLGVGEAFDPDQVTSATIVRHDGFTLLIDCGHSVLPRVWRACPDPATLDAIFLTHHHADHVAGLPSLLDSWSCFGRTKPMLIVTTEWGENQLRQLCALYGIETGYPVRYARAEATPELGPFVLRTAPTQHAVPNQALRLEAAGRRFAYSGDGRPTPDSLALYADADLLLHECWEIDPLPDDSFHCDLARVRQITGPTRTGLYHVHAPARARLAEAIAHDPKLFVADPGTTLEL